MRSSGPPKIVALALTLLLAGVLFETGCVNRPATLVSETRLFLLGTVCTVTLYRPVPDGIFDRIFSRIEEIDRCMSAQRPDSEIVAVNAAAGESAVRVSGDTFYVISRGLEFGRLSGGAFDITIGPLVDLWGIGTENQTVPSAEEISEKQVLVGYRDVVLNEAETSVFLKRKGMRLDLGGIAKGYAADETVRILRESGVQRGLIVLGGNVFALGKKVDGTPWRIGVQDPDGQRGVPMGMLDVSGKTVVSSGTYERYFESDGVRYHHILDPSTGYPVGNGLVSTTIVAGESLAADALSTAVFVLGLDKGRALVESLGATELVTIDDERKVFVTPALRDSFRILEGDFTFANDSFIATHPDG